MARGSGGRRAREEKARRLTEALDLVITGPPYAEGFDPMAVSRAALERLPAERDITKPQAKKGDGHLLGELDLAHRGCLHA